METGADLERSFSQHSATSIRSRRSATVRAQKGRKLVSQPSSSASSIAPSDKSLTSFPSFSPESPVAERLDLKNNTHQPAAADDDQLRAAAQQQKNRGLRSESIVDTLTGSAGTTAARNSLFEDAPVTKVPGALHQADDTHIERLIARHGAVGLVRQIAEDLAQRDSQIATLRRRADERERALRRIIRECGLSNMELETRLRTVEGELREGGRARHRLDSGLSDMMSDAMQETMTASAYGETGLNGSSTLRASGAANGKANENGKGTSRGWKDYFWGTGTAKKSQASSVNGDGGANTAAVIRSHSSLDRRPGLHDDLFDPPDGPNSTNQGGSRPSSIHSANIPERRTSGSLASLALRLVAGGAISGRESETRGRATSNSSGRDVSVRAPSAANNRSSQSTRSASVAGGPRALMAMRRSTPVPSAQAAAASRYQAQELWDTMGGGPPSALRQESYGPVEMDAILPPDTQPPTLTHIYNNYDGSEFLTDRFGFIYDQRRKKRQREAAQMARHIRKGSRTEMLMNGRTGISPNLLEDMPSPKWSMSSDGRPESPNSSLEDKDKDKGTEEGKTKRWQDYLKIATFPTELLSHTPSMNAPSLEVLEASEATNSEGQAADATKSLGITPTESGLMPSANTTTAVDSQVTQPSEPELTPESLVKEDREPVKLLLRQLSDLHDSLQAKKTPQWNDFLRKVRAERKREGEAAIAAANAAAEARYERPAVILPETRVADGEIIGISDLGNKGKVGRAKWNEFRNLVLGGIPVAYRAKIWSECSRATALRIPGYYEDLVAQSSDSDDPIVISQIGMDIHRTLTDNIFFRKGPGVQKLKEVLVAYSRRNKDVGYCQGMNLIVANLLLIMPSAEDAFWVLTSIVEHILPPGYYDHSLMSSRADQQVLRQYVSTVLPKLSVHLDSLSIELETMTFQWFLSVFTDCLCAEALFRVWDVVLCTNDGSTFLFQVALALLKLNEGNLLQCSTPAAVYTYIGHHMTEHAISIDGLMQASEGLRKVVRREDVEQRREKVLQAERELLAVRDEHKNQATDIVSAQPQPTEA